VSSQLSTVSHPLLYEIKTWPWLEAISGTEQQAVDLGSVPPRYWDEIAEGGFDGVWLMGVWQRSPTGIAIALSNDDLRDSFSAALPDWQPYDVVGSPYCVRDPWPMAAIPTFRPGRTSSSSMLLHRHCARR
jgi:hypothetical protein